MLAMRKIIKRENIKGIDIPEEMGEYVEIIILPAEATTEVGEGYFEIITEDGENIKVQNWTEEEWNYLVLRSLLNSKEDDEDWEDIFEAR
jgi:hypothetical protein